MTLKFDSVSTAIVRRPTKSLAGIEHKGGIGAVDIERAREQFDAYCAALKSCGVEIVELPEENGFPAACFVEDMAVITDYLAVVCNPGDKSDRQGEQSSGARILAESKFMKFITAPGVLDGGDVVRINNHFYIGLSPWTNQEGASQLGYFLKEFGYDVTILSTDIPDSPQLSGIVSYIGDNTIIIREDLEKHFAFIGYDKIVVPVSERGAINCLPVNGKLVFPAGFTNLREILEARGFEVVEVNISEFEKLNAGLGSLSLRLPAVKKPKDAVIGQEG